MLIVELSADNKEGRLTVVFGEPPPISTILIDHFLVTVYIPGKKIHCVLRLSLHSPKSYEKTESSYINCTGLCRQKRPSSASN
jgi:hypothetical protein